MLVELGAERVVVVAVAAVADVVRADVGAGACARARKSRRRGALGP